jgi:GTP pyrophosphokinase
VAIEGKQMLERRFRNSRVEFKTENIDKLVSHFNLNSSLDLFYLIGIGEIDKSSIHIQEIVNYEKKKALEHRPSVDTKPQGIKPGKADTVIIGDNDTDFDYTLARCCNPIPGDDIFAFVTVGEGIKIHRTNCPNGVDLMANYGYRILKARWTNADPTLKKAFLASIQITGTDSVGIVRGITDVISKELKVNMKSIGIDTVDGKFEGTIQLYIYDTNHLEQLISNLKRVDGIYSVERVG